MHENDGNPSGGRNLVLALVITVIMFICEVIGGIVTNSLALLTDAWHMLNDAIALFMAFVASRFAQRPTDMKKTFGYYRAEILAAFVNSIFLWIVVAFTFYEAIQRFRNPTEVRSLEMLIIAILGLASNGLSAIILSRSKRESLNIAGAFLHVIADTLGSVGVISAGLIMYFTGWYQADPLISVLIGLLIFYSAWKLIRDSVNVLLEGAPYNIDVNTLEKRIAEMKGVKGVHDLHVWCITPTKMCTMSCHIVLEDGVDRKKLISDLMRIARDEFGIDHTTIQLEDEGYPKAVGEH